jgi:hypothetical protein
VTLLDRSFVSSSRQLGMLFALLSIAGCQPLDEGAARGEPWLGEPQTSALDTSAIELPDGGTARDGCEATNIEARAILERTCARCHGGGGPGARQGAPPFDSVLDTTRLVTMVSATAKDTDTHKPARFLVPGDPDHSRIYLRPLNGEMPPPDVIGLPPNPRPSVSDLSVLRHWVESCVGPTDTQGDDAGEPETDAPDTQTATH